ncbi:T9SS type A sorting domain-containing protein [candidate division KSB1 bacterium]|nr:T9SS type A sorting domain-containing protein [candidate division KSB1 bacterium]
MKQTLKCCTYLLFICLILTSMELYGQTSESGAPTGSAEIIQTSPSRIEADAEREALLSPIQHITTSKLPIGDQNLTKDTESKVQALAKAVPAWQHLEQLDQADKENATISIELFNNQPQDVIVLSHEIMNLWRTGDYSNATLKLKELHSRIGSNNYGIGVAWKTPRIVENPSWGGDVNVTTNDEYWEANFDFHQASRNLLAVGRRKGGNDPRFTIHISTNQGASWTQTWYWWGGEMIDVSGAVVGNYFYVSYVYEGEPMDARIRRFLTSNGSEDTAYGWKSVFNKSVNVKELVTVCNQDYFNNMCYVVGLLENNQIVWFIDDPEGSSFNWNEINTFITDAAHGLSSCYSNNDTGYWFYVSYITTASKLSIMRSKGSSLVQTKTFTTTDARDITSISGYLKDIICAYEQYSSTYSRTGIRYYVTSDGGENYMYNDIAVPTANGYFGPGVSARRNCGYALAYQSEMGAFDPLYYSKRDYNLVNWGAFTQINSVDVFTGSATCVEHVPNNYGHGVLWVSEGTVAQSLHFDKNPDCATPVCSIHVTSPNGGESVGCSKTITWTSSNASANVKIEYYCNGTWYTIVNSTANDGSYAWTVPNNTVCSSAKIRITDTANAACTDMSDNYFSINCVSCSFTITAPNGGENIGCSTTITWTSTGAGSNVKLEYYCGGVWSTIVSSTPNDGTYNWTIPTGTVCSSKIKVSDAANSGCWDMSNNYFNINCPIIPTCQITVTSPNGGESIACSHTILWTSSNASANVKIEYQCNSTWNVIVNSTPNDGTFNWTIPSGTSCTTAKVRITDVANAACSDQSNSNFTINCGVGPCTPPYVKAEDVMGAPGMNIEVPIHMKGNTALVDAFGFEFKYCSDKLHLLEVVKGPLTAAFSFFQYQEATPGNVTIGGFHTTAIPVNSDGAIAIVKLHVDACSVGETCVLTIAGLVDDLVGMNACNGTFTCGTPCKLGDVNNDGSLTPGDALCAFQIYLNGGTPPAGTACDNECALFAADVNCTPDGITPGDALYIFQGYLGGKTPPLDCKPAALPKESDLSLSIPSAEGKPAEEVILTITLDRTEPMQAFGFDLGYPAELLTFMGVRAAGMTEGWDMLDGKTNVDGVVTVGGFNGTVQQDQSSLKLVDVVFKVNDDAEGLGDLWLFNMSDDLAQAAARPGRFATSLEGIRRLGGLEVPTDYYLEQNYPNPFNMDTEIIYQLPEAGMVTVTIYNSVGHQIRSLVNQHHSAGKYAARWNGKDDLGNDTPSGVYLYHIKTNKFSDSKKMLLIK